MTNPSYDLRIGSAPDGCASPTASSCPSEVLVAPRFYPGELLAARDLDAILGYTRSRLALDRYRDGWGVACGLGVGLDPSCPHCVLVGCGYALDPRGRDVLVPETVPFDLGRVAGCASGAADLYVFYESKEAAPWTTACRPSGTLDSYRLEAFPVSPDEDPLRGEVERFRAAWEATSDVVAEFYRGFRVGCGPPPSGVGVRSWLERWIRCHPLYQLAWIAGAVECLPDCYDEADTVRVLFFLVQDARLRLIAESTVCAPCGDPWSGNGDDCGGVLLARILTGADTICRIDTFAPYRRPLVRGTWPAPLGRVNLVQVLGNRWAEARSRLAALGLEVEPPSLVRPPTTYRELDREIESEIFAPRGVGSANLRPRVLEEGDGCGKTERAVDDAVVVGFEPPGLKTGEEATS